MELGWLFWLMRMVWMQLKFGFDCVVVKDDDFWRGKGWSEVGVGNFHVNLRFHPTNVGWNLGLTRKFTTRSEVELIQTYMLLIQFIKPQTAASLSSQPISKHQPDLLMMLTSNWPWPPCVHPVAARGHQGAASKCPSPFLTFAIHCLFIEI